MKIAPIYDCGSCLYSQLTDEQMQEILRYEIILENSYKKLIKTNKK